MKEKIGGMEKNKKEREGRWVVERKKRVRGGNDRKGGEGGGEKEEFTPHSCAPT